MLSKTIQRIIHINNILRLFIINNNIIFRRNMIIKIKELTYLDTRPVREKDRLCAEAWLEGGLEAERKLREKWADEDLARTKASVMHIIS